MPHHELNSEEAERNKTENTVSLFIEVFFFFLQQSLSLFFFLSLPAK